MNLDDVFPDEDHLKRYRVWYTVEVEAEAPEVAAGMSRGMLATGEGIQFEKVEEIPS